MFQLDVSFIFRMCHISPFLSSVIVDFTLILWLKILMVGLMGLCIIYSPAKVDDVSPSYDGRLTVCKRTH